MIVANILLALCCYLIFKVLQALYRITLHPLAKFPGPKLAAASRWYEIYYQLVTDGAFTDQVSLIHEQYGPIVRIGPNELHIDDPEFYDTLFNFSPQLDKRKYALDNLQHTASHAQHKLRRHGFDSFFSRANVTVLESLIRDNIGKLCGQLGAARKLGEPVSISLLFRCLTADIITEYSFGRNFGYLDNPQGSKPFFSAWYDGFKTLFLIRENKLYERMMFWPLLLPEYCLPPKDTKMGNFLRMLQEVRKDTFAATAKDPKDGERRTIFTELSRNEKLPASERTGDVVFSNALLLVSAGLETTAHTLETGLLHLNTAGNEHMLEKLKGELKAFWPDQTTEIPSWKSLETLPYFQAVLKESLRLALGVSSKLSRINHHEAMMYGQYVMPAGTEISMTQRDLHFNASLFPDPWAFKPERWLGKEGKEREKYLISFSRGSRVCIGMNLAMAELNTTLATMVRRFDVELFESDRRDVDMKYDYFVPFPETGEKGVFVKVR